VSENENWRAIGCVVWEKVISARRTFDETLTHRVKATCWTSVFHSVMTMVKEIWISFVLLVIRTSDVALAVLLVVWVPSIFLLVLSSF